jgi:hypothetical protein
MHVKTTTSITLEDGETPASLAKMCRNAEIGDCPIYGIIPFRAGDICPIMGDKHCQYIKAWDWRKALKQGEFEFEFEFEFEL